MNRTPASLHQIKLSRSQSSFASKPQTIAYKKFDIWPSTNIQDATNEYLIMILVCLVTAIFMGVGTVFAIKYLIAATQRYGLPEHCVSQQMSFDGWEFLISCKECASGYLMNSNGACSS